MLKFFTSSITIASIIMSLPAQAQTWPTLNGQEPLIIGHRGAPGYLPDHTLEGYARAARMGANFVEPDLVSTKDGVLIARHEPNLKDTTDVAKHPEFAALKHIETVDGKDEEGWFASDFTLAQIKTLRAVQPRADRTNEFNGLYQIPTFEEILTLRAQLSKELGREIGVYPETKHPSWHAEKNLGFEKQLISILSKYNLNRADAPVYIQSFELANLKVLKAMSPVKRIYLIDGTDVLPDGTVTSPQPYDFVKSGDPRRYDQMMSDAALQEIAAVANGIGPWKPYIASYSTDAAGVKTRIAPSDLIARAHKAGLALHPFTFRNEAKHLTDTDKGDPYNEYALFFGLGVDGLFSDYTDTAVAARAKFKADNLKK
jgi:glycerophosphoryl diester phosphodiesterase